jgi:hypothetical protein
LERYLDVKMMNFLFSVIRSSLLLAFSTRLANLNYYDPATFPFRHLHATP